MEKLISLKGAASPTASPATPSRASPIRSALSPTVGEGSSPNVFTRVPEASATSSDTYADDVVFDGGLNEPSKTPLIAGTVGGVVGAIVMIVVLALLCIYMKKRRKKNEEEKRILGYYMAPAGRVEGQEDVNGMFYLLLYVRDQPFGAIPLDIPHWYVKGKDVVLIWPSTNAIHRS